MNKYLYKIKDLEVPPWLKYWFARKSKINFDLSEILNGTSFDLTDTVNKKLHLINIFGNSIQNGEPTPENPINIKSSGDNRYIVEKFVNKNLFNTENIKGNRILDVTTGEEEYMDDSRWFVTDFINVPFSNLFTISGKIVPNGWRLRVCGYDKDKNYLNGFAINDYRNKTNINFNVNINYLRLTLYNQNLEQFIQLETGSTPTDYETHQEQTYTIPCQQPMRAIGDVKDTFVKVNGVWYERHYINRLILRGSQNWWASSSQVVDRYFMNLSDGKILDDYREQVSYCNYYHYDYNSGEVGAFYLGSYQGTTRVFMNYAEKDASTLQDFKDFLEEKFTQEKPIYIDYVLKEPLDLLCTQAQITALENLQKAKTYKDVTHIYSEDEVPADLQIQYYKEKGE